MKKIGQGITVLLFMLAVSTSAFAQSAKMQSAFIYQFTKLIEWCPDGKTGDFTIGVLGSGSDVAKELDRLHGRKVGSQTIKLVSFSSPSQVAKCNILYVPKSYISQLGTIKNALSGGCTLVVSDDAGAYAKGAGISFDTSGGKLEFELNQSDLEKSGFKVSSKLSQRASKKI